MADDIINALQTANRSASVLQGIANPPQVNPLAAISAGNQAAQAEFQTRKMQADQALGDAYRQAVDPETGRFNPLKFNQIMGGNPMTSFAAKGGVESSQVLQGAQLEQNAKMQGLLNESITAALASPDANLKDAVLQQAARLKAAGYPTDRIDASLLHLSPDPTQLRQQLETVRVQSLPPDQRQSVIYGRPGGVDQGTQYQPTMTDVRRGTVTPTGPGVPVYAGPGTQGQQVQWTDNQGVMHDTTWAEYNTARGNGNVVGPVRMSPAPAPTATPPAVNGSQPPAANGPQTRTDTTRPEPGMEAKWKASADAYNAANAEAGTYQQRVFPLVQAHTILKSGDVTTGAGAEALNAVKSRLMTVATTLGADAQTIAQADFDKTAKYMQQYVNQMGLSGRSDQAMASAISGNPSAHISTLANQQILPVMIGMERMKQTIFTDFQKGGGKPNGFSDYQTNWQNTHDPRAFIFDMMDVPAREKMVKGMSPTQRQAFARTLDLVERNPGVMGQAAMPGH